MLCSLTYDGEDQQDAADDNGDDDRGLSSPKVQHRNCVVEFSNLDLEREKEGGNAGAEQHVAKRLKGGARRDYGAVPSRPSPKDVLTTLAQPTGLRGEAVLCLSLLDLGDFVCLKRAQFPSCVLWWKAEAGSQQAAVPQWCPSQGHHRASAAEPQALAHVMAPPYPPQSTRQPLLREFTSPYSTACTIFTRKPLPLI